MDKLAEKAKIEQLREEILEMLKTQNFISKINENRESEKLNIRYEELSKKINSNIKLIEELENYIKPDLEIFIDTIKSNNHHVEIEIYDHTINHEYIFTDINEFSLFMDNNHEITIDNIFINGYIIESELSYRELAKLVDNNDPVLVNEIMVQTGLSIEKSVELFEDGFKIKANDKVEAFKEWFSIYRSETYKQILEMKIVSGVKGSEIYIDWNKVCQDYQSNNTINIFNVDNNYIIC